MTSTSFGVGGNVGGPPQPSTFEMETTAATRMNRATLGIVPDSIDQTFTLTDPRYNAGYLGGFGYKSTAGRPLLGHPLESTRVSGGVIAGGEYNWRSTYEDLVEQLPPDLLSRFNADSNKPFEERNPLFVALDNVLSMAAKGLGRAMTLSQSDAPGSLEETRTTINLLLPFAALQGSISTSTEIGQTAQEALTQLGPNYRYFDGLNHTLNQMQEPLGMLQEVNDNLTNTPGWELSPQSKATANTAAVQFATMSDQMQRVSLGDDLQVLQPTLQTLATVAGSLSLPYTGTATLFIGMSTALNGIDSSKNSLGIVGPGLNALFNSISNGIVASTMTNTNAASSELFNLLVTASLTILLGLAALAVDPGIGAVPERTDTTSSATQFFAFETALQFIAGSNVLGTIFRELVVVSGGNAQAQELGTTSLTQLAHLLAAASGTVQGNQQMERQVETQRDYLQAGILAAELLSATKSDENIQQSSEQSTTLAIALGQANIALEEQNYGSFIAAFTNVLEILETSYEGLLNEIKTVGNQTQNIVSSTTQMQTDQPMTNIVNVV